MTHAPEKKLSFLPLTRELWMVKIVFSYTHTHTNKHANKFSSQLLSIIKILLHTSCTHIQKQQERSRRVLFFFLKIQFHDVFISEEKTLTSSHTLRCDSVWHVCHCSTQKRIARTTNTLWTTVTELTGLPNILLKKSIE